MATTSNVTSMKPVTNFACTEDLMRCDPMNEFAQRVFGREKSKRFLGPSLSVLKPYYGFFRESDFWLDTQVLQGGTAANASKGQ